MSLSLLSPGLSVLKMGLLGSLLKGNFSEALKNVTTGGIIGLVKNLNPNSEKSKESRQT